MRASFTVIASTTHKLINNVRHHGILSLNVKKLANPVEDLKIIWILKKKMLLLMLFCKRVLKQKEEIPKYGNTINNYFWENIFCENCLFKNILMQLSTKLVGK